MSPRLVIGIIDLIARRPTRSPYATLLLPNFASIMPQAVGVWCEELGHEVHYLSYTGREDLRDGLPKNLDLVFLSAFTSAAYLAYGLSSFLRARGAVTVLGGPHARAYAEDAAHEFDYVVGFADKALILDLLAGFSAQRPRGVRLSAARQPASLPGIRERWKFVRANLEKAHYYGCVPSVGSLGCPYQCSFCVDAEVPYQPLAYDQIREDLTFLLRQERRPMVGWHDPNFGIRFDDYMGVIEEAAPPGSLRFAAESSLSLLGERNLRRLRRNGFDGLIVGIESWYGFNAKARQRSASGEVKMKAVAEHVAEISRHIPYTQTNFVHGLDVDAGEEPFLLTQRFLDLAPTVYPAFSLFTAFGDAAPLGRDLAREGRVLATPFTFLDCGSLHNVLLKNYGAAEFYRRLADLLRDAFSAQRSWRRLRENSHPLGVGARWLAPLRSLSSRSWARHYEDVAARAEEDTEYRAFFRGESDRAPRRFAAIVAKELGPFYAHLSARVRRGLEGSAVRAEAA